MSKLTSAEAVLEWAGKNVNWPNEAAERLALGQRVLAIVEWSATRESCYAPEVRAMFESVLENAEARKGDE